MDGQQRLLHEDLRSRTLPLPLLEKKFVMQELWRRVESISSTVVSMMHKMRMLDMYLARYIYMYVLVDR